MRDRILLANCVVHQNGRILLGHKKQGLGKGWWNHAGGHVEAGETPEAAARRELQEEFGLAASVLEYAGVLVETFEDGTSDLEVHVFLVKDFTGEPVETSEMVPRWFPLGQIPYDDMWPDDRHWMPLVFSGKKFRGRFTFRDIGTMLTVDLEELTDVA